MSGHAPSERTGSQQDESPRGAADALQDRIQGEGQRTRSASLHKNPPRGPLETRGWEVNYSIRATAPIAQAFQGPQVVQLIWGSPDMARTFTIWKDFAQLEHEWDQEHDNQYEYEYA